MSRSVRNWKVKPEGRQAIWSAIRWGKRFTLSDLQTMSGQPYNSCKKYVRALFVAGYLRLVHRANTQIPGDSNSYQLVRNSGPLPPIPRKKEVVWDPNLEEEFDFDQVDSVSQRIWDCIAGIPEGETFTAVRIQGLTGSNLRSIRKYLKVLTDQGLIARPLESYRDRGVYVRVVQEVGDA